MRYQITVRFGGRRQRYETLFVEAPDAREAMVRGAEAMPDAVAADADLIELRVAVDPEQRHYAGDADI